MPRQTNIKPRRGTAAQWSSANPTLDAGEIGFETDTKIIKIGDGTSAWSTLAPVFTTTYASRWPTTSAETIIIGDSIDANPDGWFEQLCILSGQKVTRLRNGGIGGNTTAQMLARLQTDAIAYNPKIVILGGPTNDHGINSGISVAQTKANYQSMVNTLRAAGITPVVRNCPPVENGGTGLTLSQRQALIENHNTWLESWGKQNGVPILDMWAPLVDPTDGTFLSGLSSDDVHPSTLGAHTVAQYLVTKLPAIFNGSVMLAGRHGQNGQLIPSGTNALMGDTNANNQADGWNFANTSGTTFSIIAGTGDVKGNWQRCQAATSQTQIYVDVPVTAGHTYEITGQIKTTSGRLLFRAGGNDVILDGSASEGIARIVYTAASTTNSRLLIGQGNTTVPADWQAAQVLFRDITAS